ncbi:conserved hypothetical protein [Magnetospirillum sp. LM-5]|uniref:hypothetical protein n=1 Tax=Magnetospirillum sp. LM-5 TaxID=2681466 RepID=UPI00137D1F28|nr:hypothetical protein [Magnetospirillum sp. LM-5]CAA7614460.1 conserved hypothetical protein [Magnetospirillum sp. LM-5]
MAASAALTGAVRARHTWRMFGKILLTVAVVAIIWFGFKFAQRLLEQKARRDPDQPAAGPRPVFRPDPDGESVQDLVKCPACSTWRSAKQGHCGLEKCPY